MFVPFESLPSDSRIWIYQADRLLTEDEIDSIKSVAKNFIEEWTAHHLTLIASFEIFHKLFLVLSVDESHNDASGCSIDKSIHFIKSVEMKFQLSLFDRFKIAFRRNGEIGIKQMNDFFNLPKKELISENIFIFNNLISEKSEMETGWEIPLQKSWLADKII